MINEKAIFCLRNGLGGLGNVSAQLNDELENLTKTKTARNQAAEKIKDFNDYELSVNGQMVCWYQLKDNINGVPEDGMIWARKRDGQLEIFISKNLIDLFNYNYQENEERKNFLQRTAWHEDDELILLSKGMSPKEAHFRTDGAIPLSPVWLANRQKEPKTFLEKTKRLKAFVKKPELVRTSYNNAIKEQEEIDEFTLWLTTHSGITVCRKQDAGYREFLMNAFCWFFDCYFISRHLYDKPHILPPVTFRDTNLYFVFIDGIKGIQRYLGGGFMTIAVELPAEYKKVISVFAEAGIDLAKEGGGYRNVIYPAEEARYLRLLNKVGTVKIINYMESNAAVDPERLNRYFLIHTADIKKHIGEKAYELMKKIRFMLEEDYLDWDRKELFSRKFMNYVSNWLISRIKEFEANKSWQVSVIRKAEIIVAQEDKDLQEEDFKEDEAEDVKTKADEREEAVQQKVIKKAVLRNGKRAWAEVRKALNMPGLMRGQNPNELLKRTLTVSEEQALIKLYQKFNNGLALEVLIIESRSRLRNYVNSIARYRSHFQKHLNDLFGVAEEIMLKNADEYNPEYHVKFISFVKAKGDVKGELIKYVIAQGQITQHYVYALKAIQEAEHLFNLENGYYPKSYEELLSFDPGFAERTKITENTYRNAILLRSNKSVSLTEQYSDGSEDKRMWQDFIEDKKDKSYTRIELHELFVIAFNLLYNHEDLKRSLNKDRDYEFVCLHNGFDPQTGMIYKPANLAAIGRERGLSRERPRQIASKYTQTLKGILLGLLDVTKVVPE